MAVFIHIWILLASFPSLTSRFLFFFAHSALEPPVRLEKARGGRGRGGSRRGGDRGGQLDPTQEGRAGRLRRRGRGGEHHGHDDEIPARPAARHAEEVA